MLPNFLKFLLPSLLCFNIWNNPPVQKLVWSEEFNYKGLPNKAVWSYDEGTGCPKICGWGNNELEYYTSGNKENVFVQNGVLKITALRKDIETSKYSSARIVSKNKIAFKYGKIECRAKLPTTKGTWPAFWMLGANFDKAGWPACGEIDIMEHVGNELNKIYATLHYPGNSGGNGVGSTKIISNATTAFHKYGMEWNASQIKFYIDDVLFYSFTNTNALPFNQNFFLILNVAIGGNFGGVVDPAFNAATMEIDYIRVFQ